MSVKEIIKEIRNKRDRLRKMSEFAKFLDVSLKSMEFMSVEETIREIRNKRELLFHHKHLIKKKMEYKKILNTCTPYFSIEYLKKFINE